MTGDRTRSGRFAGRDGVLFAGVVGALATVVLSFVPFSPVLGGAVAASRYGTGGFADGGGVGLLAGVFAAVPLAAVLAPAIWITGVLGFGIAPSAPAYDVFLAVLSVLFLAYTLGLSVLGGLAGVWIRDNRDWDLDPGRWL